MFNKKWFTLAELIVVMAIIWMLTAAAITIFTWAQSSARDSRRVADLNTITAALDAYYIKHRFYPQPALQTANNLWWFRSWNQSAEPTCNVVFEKDGEVYLDTIEYNESFYTCWWNIVKTRRLIKSFTCKYIAWSSTTDWILYYNDWNYTDKIKTESWEHLYEWDNYLQLCIDFFENERLAYELDKQVYIDNPSNAEMKFFLPAAEELDIDDILNLNAIIATDMILDKTDIEETIVWWKWTLTENSWKNSINTEDPTVPFYGFLKEQNFDPKYDSEKYKDYWLWYYPYAVFRDNIKNNNDIRAALWWVQYQVAATLERQDDTTNEVNPETLILWNYIRRKVDWKDVSGYPYSLIWGGKRNEIMDRQKQWEKAKNVARPNMTTNWWIPYPVEEIQ